MCGGWGWGGGGVGNVQKGALQAGGCLDLSHTACAGAGAGPSLVCVYPSAGHRASEIDPLPGTPNGREIFAPTSNLPGGRELEHPLHRAALRSAALLSAFEGFQVGVGSG